MTIGKGAGTLHGVGVPRLVRNTERSGASRHGLDERERRPTTRSVDAGEIDRLYRALEEVTPENHPRTAKLLAASTRKVAQKVFEEAGEVALEAVRHKACGVVRESADLLYNLVALWYHAGVHPDDVWAEMGSRALELGIAEKLPKDHDSRPFPVERKTREAAMSGAHKTNRRDDHAADAFRAVEPVIRSAVSVVRESVGLLHNVVAFGFALVFEAEEEAAPPPPIGATSNVISFPTDRTMKQKQKNRSRP